MTKRIRCDHDDDNDCYIVAIVADDDVAHVGEMIFAPFVFVALWYVHGAADNVRCHRTPHLRHC